MSSLRQPPELESTLLARKGRRQGAEIHFQCPFPERHKNGDHHPSARFHTEKLVWFCDVCKAGTGWRDLCELLGLRPLQDDHARPRVVCHYEYRDEAGTVLRRKPRWEPGFDGRDKSFTWQKPDGKGGWIKCKGDGNPKILYGSEKLPAARENETTIYLVEGEKDCDSATRLGLLAVCNPEGASEDHRKPKWTAGYSEQLRGLPVVIIADKDGPGRAHAQAAARGLAGRASSVRLMEMPGDWTKDFSDWVAEEEKAGKGNAEIRAAFEALVAKAEAWAADATTPPDARASSTEAASAAGAVESGEPAATTAATQEALQELWVLGPDSEPEAIERALGRIASRLAGSGPLAVQTARELAMRALRGKVSAPGKFVDAALGAVAAERRTAPAQGRDVAHPYRATEHGLIHLRTTRDGEVEVPLTNFTARIVGEVVRDDGAELLRSFEIEARHRGRDHRFEVGAARFPAMAWVAEHLGAQAVVYAGLGTKDHTRAGIQLLSEEVPVRTVYTHLGWRRIAGEWCYLDAAGGIGRIGRVSGVETDPPVQLQRYLLREPPSGDVLVAAIRASLGMLELLPDEVTVPLYAAIWRSLLTAADFTLHLAGPTGQGKTEFAALAQQHFGPAMDSRHLPGSWSSTGNSLEALAFAAKDALLVVDDFAPEGSTFDILRQHKEAARFLRAQGNRSGRSRLRADGTLRPTMVPRGLVLSTGEDVPKAHSIRARLLVLEVESGALDWGLLPQCQADAAQGLYAQAVAGFVQWLAPQYQETLDRLRTRTAELRSQAALSGEQHRRTPSIVGDLAFGLETFLRFAREAGALTEAEVLGLWERGWRALGGAAEAQAEHLASADPVNRFRELLAAAISAGRAHVASDRGTDPDEPERWGWREKTVGTGDYARDEWQPQGDRVGWVRGENLYLEPDAAPRAAQAMATLEPLSVTASTLWKRMRERGLLVSVDEARGQNRVRVTLEGARRGVIHVRAETIIAGEPAQSSQSTQQAENTGVSGPVAWADSASTPPEPAQETRPGTLEPAEGAAASGRVGRIGRVFPGDEEPDDETWTRA